MSSNGVRTSDILKAGIVEELVGNHDGSTVRISADNFATQLASTGALFEALDSLSGQITSGSIVVSTWERLQTIQDEDGAGAEVVDTDDGTHFQATATGYNGAIVNNAGRYSYNATWARWERIGDTGLSATASTAYVNDQVRALEDAIAALAVSAGISYFDTEALGLNGTLEDDFFYVGQGGLLSLYRNDGGAAALVIEHVSQTDLTNLQNSVAAIRDDFETLFLGIKSVAPALDNAGNALVKGALYFDATLKAMFVWDGAVWNSSLEGLARFNEEVRYLERAIFQLLPNTEGAVKMRNLGAFKPGHIIANLTDDLAVPETQEAANLVPFLGLMTNASIETGTTLNGDFIKFPQGQMICRFVVAASESAAATWTFPAEFSAPPRVIATCVDIVDPRLATVGATTSVDVSFSAWKLDGTRGAPPVSLVAIGDWA